MSMPSDPAQFDAAHSDGRTAASVPVRVRLGAAGIEIATAGETKPQVWPYAHLRSSVPLRRNAGDVLLSLQPDGLQTLFVASAGFTPLLLARAPQLSVAAQRWQYHRADLRTDRR